VPGGSAEGGGDPLHQRRVQPGSVCGRQFRGDQDPRLADPLGRCCLAGQSGGHLPGNGSHVLGPGLEVLVLELAVLRRHLFGSGVPRVRGVALLIEDQPASRPEECLVIKEQQMGIEDPGVILTGAVRYRIPCRPDLGPNLVQRMPQPIPFGFRILDPLRRDVWNDDLEPTCRSERDPRRGRKAGQGRARLRRRCRSGFGRGERRGR